MKKKANYNSLLWALASFFLAGFLVSFCVYILSKSEGVSFLFFKSTQDQLEDVFALREAFYKGRIFIGDALSDIITCHLYPSFILAMIIGGSPAVSIIRNFLYVRFGLMALSMNQLCTKSFKLPNIWALALSLAYAFSSLSLASSTNPLLMNLMILLPFITGAMDELLRKSSKAVFWRGVIILSLLVSTGFQGIITGIIYIFALIWILYALAPNMNIKRGLVAWGLSIIPMLLVIIPVVTSGLRRINIITAFKEGSVGYTTFDLMTSFLDGMAITLPPNSDFAPAGLSILVLILILLFFINARIPFKGKIISFIVIVLFLASCASSTLRDLLSWFGYDDAGAFSRMAALSIILMVLACISFKNIHEISKNQMFVVAFALLALICISNVTSASEVVRSPFYLYFSAAAVIYWCFNLSGDMLRRSRNVIIVASIGLIGLSFNLYHTLKVSEFAGDLSTLAPYGRASSDTLISTNSNEPIPLCGRDSEYIAVEMDLSSNGFMAYPEMLNLMSNSYLLPDVYSDASAFCVFSSGVIDEGNGHYSIPTVLTPIEILIRCQEMNPSDNYYAYSSFSGNVVFSEEMADSNIMSDYSGPFMRKINRGVAASLRLSGEPSNQYGSFSVWRENRDSMSDFVNHINGMEDFSFVVDDNPISKVPNQITVVTSIPYSPRYRMDITNSHGNIDCNIINLCGKLACVYQGDGVSDYNIRIKTSAAPLYISMLVWFISISVYIYNTYRKNSVIAKEELNVKQENI